MGSHKRGAPCVLPPLVSPPAPSGFGVTRVKSAPNFRRLRGHSSGDHSPPGALAAKWSRQLPPSTQSEAAAIVCDHLSNLNECLRNLEPRQLEDALRQASGNQYMRMITALRRSRSVTGLQRHALEAALATHMVKARTILSEWKPTMQKDSGAKRQPRSSRGPHAEVPNRKPQAMCPTIRSALRDRNVAAVRQALQDMGSSGSPKLKEEAQQLLQQYDVQADSLKAAIAERDAASIELALQAWEFDPQDELAQEASSVLDTLQRASEAPAEVEVSSGAVCLEDVPGCCSKSDAGDRKLDKDLGEGAQQSEPLDPFEKAVLVKQEPAEEVPLDVQAVVGSEADDQPFADDDAPEVLVVASARPAAHNGGTPCPDGSDDAAPGVPPKDDCKLSDAGQGSPKQKSAPRGTADEASREPASVPAGPASDGDTGADDALPGELAAAGPPFPPAAHKGPEPDEYAMEDDEFETGDASPASPFSPCSPYTDATTMDDEEFETADACAETEDAGDGRSPKGVGSDGDGTRGVLEMGDAGRDVEAADNIEGSDPDAERHREEDRDAQAEMLQRVISNGFEPDTAEDTPGDGVAPHADSLVTDGADLKSDQGAVGEPHEGSTSVSSGKSGHTADQAVDVEDSVHPLSSPAICHQDDANSDGAPVRDADAAPTEVPGARKPAISFDPNVEEHPHPEPEPQHGLKTRDYTMTFEDDAALAAPQPGLQQRDYSMAFESDPEEAGDQGQDADHGEARDEGGRGDAYDEFGFEPETPQGRGFPSDPDEYEDEAEGFETDSAEE